MRTSLPGNAFLQLNGGTTKIEADQSKRWWDMVGEFLPPKRPIFQAKLQAQCSCPLQLAQSLALALKRPISSANGDQIDGTD